jgi:hypothetical protein
VVGGIGRNVLPIDNTTPGSGGATACQLRPWRGLAGNTTWNDEPSATTMTWAGSLKLGGTTGPTAVVVVPWAGAGRPERAFELQAVATSDRQSAATSRTPGCHLAGRGEWVSMPGSMSHRPPAIGARRGGRADPGRSALF